MVISAARCRMPATKLDVYKRQHWNNGGISSTGGKNPTTTVSGGVEVRVYCSSEDVKPASSNIVLYRNGKVQDMQPIDIKDFTGDSTFYTLSLIHI